jgi:hypothetical protein
MVKDLHRICRCWIALKKFLSRSESVVPMRVGLRFMALGQPASMESMMFAEFERASCAIVNEMACRTSCGTQAGG